MRPRFRTVRRRAPVLPLIAVVALMMAMAPLLPAMPVAAQESQIGLTKLVCPEGFDGMNSDQETLAATCTDLGTGLPFALLPIGGDLVEVTTDDEALALWTDVPSGTGIITETAAVDTRSRVFCDIAPENGGEVDYEDYGAIGNAIMYELDEGQSLDCVWYNLSLPPERESEVHVTKYSCADEIDWDLLDRQALLAECGAVQSGVEFVLTTSDGAERSGVTDDTGVVTWNGLPAGAFVLTEEVLADTVAARVFCADIEFDSDGDPSYLEYVVDGASIDGSILANHELDCVWFNAVSTPPQSEIAIAKYVCPEGFDWSGLSLGQASVDCVETLADTGFTVTGPGVDVSGQTDANGEVGFSGPPGDYIITEETPAGYQPPRTACSIYPTGGTPANYQEFELANGAFAVTLNEGESIDCVWFNNRATAAPTATPAVTATATATATAADPGPASITINKYTCPEGYDLFEPDADPAAECDLPTEDITFRLSDGAAASTGTGGAPSTISFGNLQPGRYVVTEEQPGNVDFAFVLSCTSDQRTFVYPFSPFAIVEPDGRLPVELVAGEDLECDWFDVLAPPQNGIVTLTKFWCPGELVNFDACERYTEGIGFTLVPVDGVGDEISIVTGPDGTVTFEAAGVFDVTEEGYEWCFAESDSLNADGSLTVNAGQAASITIYNCGEPPPPSA